MNASHILFHDEDCSDETTISDLGCAPYSKLYICPDEYELVVENWNETTLSFRMPYLTPFSDVVLELAVWIIRLIPPLITPRNTIKWTSIIFPSTISPLSLLVSPSLPLPTPSINFSTLLPFIFFVEKVYVFIHLIELV